MKRQAKKEFEEDGSVFESVGGVLDINLFNLISPAEPQNIIEKRVEIAGSRCFESSLGCWLEIKSVRMKPAIAGHRFRD